MPQRKRLLALALSGRSTAGPVHGSRENPSVPLRRITRNAGIVARDMVQERQSARMRRATSASWRWRMSIRTGWRPPTGGPTSSIGGGP